MYGRLIVEDHSWSFCVCCPVHVYVIFHSILQDKSQIEFLTENKRKLQQQLEEECDHLRKDKIKLTGECTHKIFRGI